MAYLNDPDHPWEQFYRQKGRGINSFQAFNILEVSLRAEGKVLAVWSKNP